MHTQGHHYIRSARGRRGLGYSPDVSSNSPDRLARERQAYDHNQVWEYSHAWYARVSHVFDCPNTRRHERLFDELIARHAAGGRVLDVGCGAGVNTRRLHALGATYVLGIDVSETFVAQARAAEVTGAVQFRCGDVTEPLDGRFDLICGRAILHHLDYAPMLTRMLERNLAPGGAMVFLEPLGSNAISRLYGLLVPRAHTPDERPFTRHDLRWFREQFSRVEILPYNYLSYPAGIVSSLVSRRPDNAVLRACDRADMWLARHVPTLAPRFRQVILYIERPAPASPVAN